MSVKQTVVLVWLIMLVVVFLFVLVAFIAIAMYMAYELGGWWLLAFTCFLIGSYAIVNLFPDAIQAIISGD